MRFSLAARRTLGADLDRLRRDRVLVIELSDLTHLVCQPDAPPQHAVGPEQAGVDDLASTLSAARRLPAELTVHVVVPAGAPSTASTADVEAALHRRAGYLATVAWRNGMAQRAMGLSQLPLGMSIAILSWLGAYVLGYYAARAEGSAVGLLAVSAMIAMTIAWVVSWMVIEATVLDWRLGARQAAAYDLLSRARLEVTRADGGAQTPAPTS
jgi:hypothetical protein